MDPLLLDRGSGTRGQERQKEKNSFVLSQLNDEKV
jgi:hypothetical protein